MDITRVTRRPLVCKSELPLKVQQDFDYVTFGDEYTPRFAKYRGVWYDVQDSQYITLDSPNKMGWAVQVSPDSPLAAFHAIVSDTFFSGTLFRFVSDEDAVQCARYYA